MSEKIGFIGLGIMGKPMAANLIKKGCDLLVHDINPAAVAELQGMGAAAAGPAEIGAACDILFTMLPDGATVQEVLFGAGGAAASLKPGSAVVDMSSVTPGEAQTCAGKLAPYEVGFLDAPVSGGEPRAIDGTLAFMVGGAAELFERILPYFQRMGASATLVGPCGSGCIAKLANQIVVNLNIAALAEALVLATKAGADPEKVYQAIRGGLAGSAVMEAKAPMIIGRNFKPGGKLSINLKDIKNVMATAHAVDAPLPFTGQLLEVMQALKVDGRLGEDHSAMVRYFEKLADVEVRKPGTDRRRGAVREINPLDLSILEKVARPDEPTIDALLAAELASLRKKIVVLDDDPTGVQTVHDVSVYTGWDVPTLESAFAESDRLFFVLTNSRGFIQSQTVEVHREIARNLAAAADKAGMDFILVSRSDSTLRGHYPLETQTLREEIERLSDTRFDGEIICPFFKEGGRFTLGDVHYVKEGSRLVPAGQTEFARDKTFGYRSSHLGDWCEEKTAGAYRAQDLIYISLDDLRAANLDAIEAQLVSASGFNKVIVNAIDYVDVKVFAVAFFRALAKGKRFLLRSAAAIPKVLGGVTDRALLSREELVAEGPSNPHGGIVVVGSHVNKTTRQLEELRSCRCLIEFVEFNQHLVLVKDGLKGEVARVIGIIQEHIRAGRSVAVYTRRERFDLDTADPEQQLLVSLQISDAVTALIAGLSVQPRFIVAKGGITSSDVGVKALRVRRATVLGQIRPGIPVWRTGPESKFPGMAYVIFPGNVGEETTLREVVEILA